MVRVTSEFYYIMNVKIVFMNLQLTKYSKLTVYGSSPIDFVIKLKIIR